MRLAAMLNPFAFVGSDIASAEQTEETLRELYSSKPHLAAALGISLASLSAALSGAIRAAILATLIAAICLLGRIFIERLFCRRAPGPLQPKWIRLFVTGSLLTGLGWGLSGALLIYGTTAATQTIIAGVACAIVQGAAGRAYMMPGTAFFNIAFVLGLMSIAAVADGNYLIAPASLIYVVFLSSFIVQMVRNRLRQLRAEHRTEQLLQEITEKNELLRITNDKLAAKAFEDPLTGLANRRKFDLALAEALVTCQKKRLPITLMMIDVDHFKSFNDTYGHQAGDHCLQALSRAIGSSVPPDAGLVARYGGEEFVVILPNCDQSTGLLIAERARLAVQLTELGTAADSPPRQTISIGMASGVASRETTRETLLSAADAALYEAKKQGRNRVCVRSGADLSAPPIANAG